MFKKLKLKIMPLSDSALGGMSMGISQGSQLIGGIIGNIMQKRANIAQRDYEKEMYEKNKQDSLSFWNLQNQYNSPAMQMQRLKEAGLNPNLVYGNGANALSQNLNVPSPNTSNSTKTVNPLENFNPQLNQLYDLKYRNAQIDLLKEQAESQRFTQELTSMTTALKNLEGREKTIQLKYLERALITGIQEKVATINEKGVHSQLMGTQMSVMSDENVRKWQLQGLTIRQMLENIEQTRARTSEINTNIGYINQQKMTSETQEDLNALDYVMTKSGFSKNDPVITRMIKNVLFQITQKKDGAKKQIEDLKNYILKHKH